jgi:hypothetical protein
MESDNTETVRTIIKYYDRFGRTLDRQQAAPDRQHHLRYPSEQPRDAVTCEYFNIRTSRQPTTTSYTTFHSFFDFSGPIELTQLAKVS